MISKYLILILLMPVLVVASCADTGTNADTSWRLNASFGPYIFGLQEGDYRLEVVDNRTGDPGIGFTLSSANPDIISVPDPASGEIRPAGYGKTELVVRIGGEELRRPVEVVPAEGNAPEAFREALYGFMSKWNIPGGSVAITKGEKLVIRQGLGMSDREREIPALPDSRYRIASVSKPLTSIALFVLIEEGKLSLDDRVFGPEGILNQKRFTEGLLAGYDAITVRHLLYHSGGWDSSAGGDPMFNNLGIADALGIAPPAGPEDILEYMVSRYELDFSPGSRFAYSNFGYLVLGRIIERISGRPYEEYVRENVLDRVGDRATALGRNLRENRLEGEVTYYLSGGYPTLPSVYGTGERVPTQYGGYNVEAMDAHGGWVSTAENLLRIMAGADARSARPDILSAGSLETMHTPAPVFGQYGMGWEQAGGNWFHHGSLPGSASLLYRSQGDISFAVLFNSWPQNRQGEFYNEFAPALLSAIGEIGAWPETDLFKE